MRPSLDGAARFITALLLTGLLGAAGPVRAAAAPGTADLGWLAGSWFGEHQGVRMEEHWTAPDGGLMVGMHRDVRPGRPAFFESLRIADTPQGPVYLASPAGRSPATAFRLRRLGERRVVFANPDHDYPQRILYWLDEEETLHARIEGDVDGEERASEWRYRRAAPGAGATEVVPMKKLTPVLTVEKIEPCLGFWVDRLGFTRGAEVPGEDGLAFVILNHGGVEIMYQTRASVEADMPSLAAEPSRSLLFLEVEDLDDVLRRLEGVEHVVPVRETFYGTREVAVREPGGSMVVFAQRIEAAGGD